MKLVVFDLDGTLLHTLVDLTNAVNVGLDTVNLPNVTQMQLRDMIGNGAERLVAKASGHNGDEVYYTAFDAYTEHYQQHYADNTYAYDGIIDVLDWLIDRGVIVTVFSNKNNNSVNLLCDRHFGNRISTAIGRQRGGPSKPEPFGITAIMAEYGVTTDDIVYVGDSIVDLATAHNGNVPCVCVDWGYNDRSMLQEHGAQHIASNAQQLMDILSHM